MYGNLLLNKLQGQIKEPHQYLSFFLSLYLSRFLSFPLLVNVLLL